MFTSVFSGAFLQSWCKKCTRRKSQVGFQWTQLPVISGFPHYCVNTLILLWKGLYNPFKWVIRGTWLQNWSNSYIKPYLNAWGKHFLIFSLKWQHEPIRLMSWFKTSLQCCETDNVNFRHLIFKLIHFALASGLRTLLFFYHHFWLFCSHTQLKKSQWLIKYVLTFLTKRVVIATLIDVIVWMGLKANVAWSFTLGMV